MDTIARNPLTSLGVVAVFVALALHLGIERPPTPVTGGGGAPVTAASVGDQTEISGRVTAAHTGAPPAPDGGVPTPMTVMVLDLGRGEAVCQFPVGGAAGVELGDAVTVGGRVRAVEGGRVYLEACKLIPPPKVPETKP